MIKKILKAVLPATYRKIDKSEKKILAALIKHNNCLLTEIAKLNGRIDSLENTLNNMRPLFAELKQTVENEANWKRDDLSRIIEENKNLLQLLDFSQENMFYAMYKKDGESETDAKKRFFKSLPEATGGLRLLQLGNAFLLQNLKEICDKNNLSYWLCSGSLIGAIRHAGFIPWDDDLDVAMLRYDYDKLIEVLKNNENFKVTVLYDWYAKCSQLRFKFADDSKPMFVDIFIYDLYEGNIENNFEIENRKNMIDFLEKTDAPEIQYWKKHPCLLSSDENFKAIDSIFEKYSNRKKAIYKYDTYENLKDTTVIRAAENCLFIKRLMSPNKMKFTWSTIFPLKTLQFENDSYSVPNDYDSFISSIYGDIYKLPKDIFTHFQHISHLELESVGFRKMIDELVGGKNEKY